MEEGSLGYHLELGYARLPNERRILPRVQVALELFPGQSQFPTIYAVLDTGAEVSVFDGNAELQAGWTPGDIIERAIRVTPMYGFGSGAATPGYLHVVTAYLGGYARFAELKLRVLITPPGRLEFSVLGRSDFFEQVDVTFAERDCRLFFRFRDPSALRSYA
ncbi:MAG: hypothetical protein ACRDIY_19165 [Chloroflexota bacterium]